MPGATGLQFYYAITDPKVGEEHILRKHSKCSSIQVVTVNAIIFKLQLIYSTVRTSKRLLLSHEISYRSVIFICYS